MTALPAKTSFTDAAVTEGGFKTALDDLRDYLSGLLGADGVTATARTALGINTAIYAFLPAGTRLLFYQASVPTGWTQVTSANDKVLRVVSGTGGGTGGTWTISGLSGSSSSNGSHSHTGTTGNHTLTLNEIPNVTGSVGSNVGGSGGIYDNATGAFSVSDLRTKTVAELGGFSAYDTFNFNLGGGGGSHDHSISSDGGHTHTITVSAGSSWRPSYINVVVGSKD